MSLVQYPTELPLESASELISIIRKGEVVSKKSWVGLHGWNVAGYLLLKGVGNPIVGGESCEPCNDSADERFAIACNDLTAHLLDNGAVIDGGGFATYGSGGFLLLLRLLLDLLASKEVTG